MHRAPGTDPVHQRRMLESVLALAEPHRDFGLLDLQAFHRSIDILAHGNAAEAGEAAERGWTHGIWREARVDGEARALTAAVQHYLRKATESSWFIVIGLLGTVASAFAGFMRGVQCRYDLWGAFVLTLLGFGGGIMRDLLVGGERLPLFIFKDSIYFVIVISVLTLGTLLTRLMPQDAPQTHSFDRTLSLFNTIGIAAFTVVGTKVALLAGLAWYWAPFCAALSCAGGGMLRDIVTGREPRTFQGEPYEEVAVVGSLVLVGLLAIANRHEHAEWMTPAAIAAAMVCVVVLRTLAVRFGWRSYRLGGRTTLPPAIDSAAPPLAPSEGPVAAMPRPARPGVSHAV